MTLNYKKIGDCIRLVDERNTNLNVTTLLGLSISKKFIPSVANTIGTDFKNYKIIKKNQFACSTMQVRRDKKMPVALLKDFDEAIISAAYPVFEVVDINLILPEYLMMWFSRSEFDREACFYAIGGVRGSIEWEDFCNMKLPVPSIAKQKKIVNEYKVLLNKINVNNFMIRKLEEMAQAIYKHWFIDFEFPSENGNPYKSSGGRMNFNEKINMEIPENWKTGVLSDIANILMGQSPNGESYNNEGRGMIFYQGRSDFGFRFPDVSTYTTSPKRISNKGDILLSVRAPVGDLNIAIEECCIGRGIASLNSKYGCNSHLFYLMKTLKSQFDISNEEGTVFGAINKDTLHELTTVYSENYIKKFEKLVSVIDYYIKLYSFQNNKLFSIIELLKSKMTSQKE